jgi:hypothetical protein
MLLKVSVMDRELIRTSFRPSKIRILFVGESPPANGAFFYAGSPMTTYMAQVFEKVYGETFQSFKEFLEFFKGKDCYLDDLSYTPVDDPTITPRDRRQAIDGCVGALAERMKEYKPEHVIAVLMSIGAPVRRAANIAELQVPVHAVPFPGNHHQTRFIAELSEILRRV